MATTRLQIRIDAKLKKEAESILKKQGITPAQAITMFYTEIVRTGSFPFSPSKVFNTKPRKVLRTGSKKVLNTKII